MKPGWPSLPRKASIFTHFSEQEKLENRDQTKNLLVKTVSYATAFTRRSGEEARLSIESVQAVEAGAEIRVPGLDPPANREMWRKRLQKRSPEAPPFHLLSFPRMSSKGNVSVHRGREIVISCHTQTTPRRSLTTFETRGASSILERKKHSRSSEPFSNLLDVGDPPRIWTLKLKKYSY